MNDSALIVVIIGGVLLVVGTIFTFRRGKDPAEHALDDEQRMRRELAEQEKRGRRLDEYYQQAEERGRRFDQLLAKWEEQARRQDAVLDQLEKQNGIKNEAPK